MCPTCISAALWLAGGVASTGGLAILGAKLVATARNACGRTITWNCSRRPRE